VTPVSPRALLSKRRKKQKNTRPPFRFLTRSLTYGSLVALTLFFSTSLASKSQIIFSEESSQNPDYPVIKTYYLPSLFIDKINKESSPNPGITKTNLFVQNIGDKRTIINADLYDETGNLYRILPVHTANNNCLTYNINPKAVSMLSYKAGFSDPAHPSKSSCKNFSGTNFVPNIPSTFAGAGMMFSNFEPLGIIISRFWSRAKIRQNSDYDDATGFHRAIENPSKSVFLPIVECDPGQATTEISVTNTENYASRLVLYINKDGKEYQFSLGTLYPEKPTRYFLNQVLAKDCSKFKQASARLVSTRAIVADVAIYNTNRSRNSMRYYAAVNAKTSKLLFPVLFKRPNTGLYSQISLQNTTNQTINVRLEFIGRQGYSSAVRQITIKPFDVWFYHFIDHQKSSFSQTSWNQLDSELYDARNGNRRNWVGVVKAIAANDQKITGIVSYWNDSKAFRGDGAIFPATNLNKKAQAEVSVPAVYRKRITISPKPKDSQWSTTLVMNLDTKPSKLTVEFWSRHNTTSPVATTTIDLLPNKEVAINMFTPVNVSQKVLNKIGDYFSGSLLLKTDPVVPLSVTTLIFFPGKGILGGYVN